ncbi:MAG: PQQ-dependent sugar dehydrogenase, partial [Actinomycetota bacterium]
YIAETNRVTRYNYVYLLTYPVTFKISSPQVLVPDLPSNGGHFTRTLGFGPDGKMYVSVGSSGNVVEEKDPRRAAILQFNDDGTGGRIYAKGLRNAVGFTWHPITKEMWATENGRDRLGDDLPPDEINIVGDGGDYGWPYAYGNRIPDPAFNDPKRVAKTLPPKIEIQAHSAPLGLRFYDADSFGPEYKDDLFVAFHGSWNRTVPTGYKVVRYHLKGKRKDEVEFQTDFITGWLTPQGALGRPVDIIVGADKALYISDDKAGTIYRVSKIKK